MRSPFKHSRAYAETLSSLVVWLTLALICIVFVLLCCAPWLLHSYLESSTYNRLTGAHTTTWDAMWVELRVQDSPRK